MVLIQCLDQQRCNHGSKVKGTKYGVRHHQIRKTASCACLAVPKIKKVERDTSPPVPKVDHGNCAPVGQGLQARLTNGRARGIKWKLTSSNAASILVDVERHWNGIDVWMKRHTCHRSSWTPSIRLQACNSYEPSYSTTSPWILYTRAAKH